MISDGDVTAVGVSADVLLGSVGLIEETVLDDHGHTVTDQTVTLHLSEPESSAPGTSLGGLAGKDLDGSSGPVVELSADHVVQLLVEDDSGVDVHGDHLSGDSVVHRPSTGNNAQNAKLA